jgi:hypothetical protein
MGRAMMKSLKGFPGDFQPLIIVTGDRREVPPLSKGDVLAYSFSSTDVMYLNSIKYQEKKDTFNDGLVVSDKQFVTDDEETLRHRFGSTNILVIGSPAVNLLARRINESCSFRFSISEETKKELQEQNDLMDELITDDDELFIYHQCLEGILDADTMLKRYVDLNPHIDELREKANTIVRHFKQTMVYRHLPTHSRPVRYLMHKLDKPGIYDTHSNTNRGEAIGPYMDYGLITILQNPFSDGEDYSIIYVAGVHGPGTAIGVRMLGEKGMFESHPSGGVYQVKIKRVANYYEKIQQSTGIWETPGYKKYIKEPEKPSIKVFLSSPSKKNDKKQQKFNDTIKEIVQNICEAKGIDTQVEEPYSFVLGGKEHDFWQTILEYEKECRFILHDITDCARGVMVEIGFSFGAKRQYFLIYNKAKNPKVNLGEILKPSLLPVTQIEEIDIENFQSSRRKIRERIVDRVLIDDRPIACSTCIPLQKKENIKSSYIYSKEPTLTKCLEDALRTRSIRWIPEETSKKELRICKICQVMSLSDFVLIHLSNEDPDGFILLGMAKAMGKKTFSLTLDRYGEDAFAWAHDSQRFQIKSVKEDLEEPLATFFAY